jgi:hypothetical protein
LRITGSMLSNRASPVPAFIKSSHDEFLLGINFRIRIIGKKQMRYRLRVKFQLPLCDAG